MRFVCADAAAIALRLREEGTKPDTVVVDPPRKGLEETVIREIAGMAPERVVYISCNPSTLARDLLRFSENGYRMLEAEAFDMFPRTSHIETAALLCRKDDETPDLNELK